MMIIIIGFIFVCFIAGVIEYIKNPKPPRMLSYNAYKQYYTNKEWLTDIDESDESDEINESDELHDITKNERIIILDETIVKYNKLLDNLTEQYKNTYNDKEKTQILAKQIATMEKLNRALEKREKLDN